MTDHPDPSLLKQIEDAGEAGQGTKYDNGKAPHALLDPYALDQLSQVLAFGAAKYGEHNWRKGIKWSRLISAAMRHLLAFMAGEINDPESGLPHVAHAMCCCMFLLGLQHRPILDDRYQEAS